MSKRGRKPGPVWEFFELTEDKLHATCNACGSQRCKNVITLENHMDQCDDLTDNDREKWQDILGERLKGRPGKRRRTGEIFGGNSPYPVGATAGRRQVLT